MGSFYWLLLNKTLLPGVLIAFMVGVSYSVHVAQWPLKSHKTTQRFRVKGGNIKPKHFLWIKKLKCMCKSGFALLLITFDRKHQPLDRLPAGIIISADRKQRWDIYCHSSWHSVISTHIKNTTEVSSVKCASQLSIQVHDATCTMVNANCPAIIYNCLSFSGSQVALTNCSWHWVRGTIIPAKWVANSSQGCHMKTINHLCIHTWAI